MSIGHSDQTAVLHGVHASWPNRGPPGSSRGATSPGNISTASGVDNSCRSDSFVHERRLEMPLSGRALWIAVALAALVAVVVFAAVYSGGGSGGGVGY
jgi:hypothetical protein